MDFKDISEETAATAEDVIKQIDARQEVGRSANDKILESVAQLQTESVTVQNNLVGNLVDRTVLLSNSEKENHHFSVGLAERSTDKYDLRGQINDIQHLIRMLNQEISTHQSTKDKVEAVVEVETTLAERKKQDALTLVDHVTDDVNTQIKSLDTQTELLTTMEGEQNRIEAELDTIYDQSHNDLSKTLGQHQ